MKKENSHILDFEKPIYIMQEKIKELEAVSGETKMNYNKEIKILKKQTQEYKKELYSSLEPFQKLQIARHVDRPTFLDYVNLMTEDFVELHGDRTGSDDRAIIGGVARIAGQPVMIIGTQKGKTTKENLEYNFGMPQPQGYRKALRLMEHASKFSLPIITLVDTTGAYPGIMAEQTAQGTAIAVNIREMAKLDVPIISIITGEGCSGGALGLAVANKVMILEYAYYTVISPEGCASILWRDATRAKDAADALKITGEHLLEFGIVDSIINEPEGGAHHDPEAMAEELKEAILVALKEFKGMSHKKLKEQRYDRFRKLGVFVQ
ncbi:acetyl-CoA carboxylase carboxyltransferase subunit alpha [bacterium]|nr:acetyl-CoA carboxylase carboxyltransferase subunit alpha [bacterium]